MQQHSFAYFSILYIFASEQAAHALVIVFAEAQDSFSQRTLVLKADLLVGTPAADILLHGLALYTIEVQFHKTVTYHQFGGLGAVAFAPGSAITDYNIEFCDLVNVIYIILNNMYTQA